MASILIEPPKRGRKRVVRSLESYVSAALRVLKRKEGKIDFKDEETAVKVKAILAKELLPAKTVFVLASIEEVKAAIKYVTKK